MKSTLYQVNQIMDFLVRFLTKLYNDGHRVCVFVPDEAFLKALDDSLWTARSAAFIPHATCLDRDFIAADQPIWLALGPYRNENHATVVVSVRGAIACQDGVERFVEVSDVPCADRSQFSIVYKESEDGSFRSETDFVPI